METGKTSDQQTPQPGGGSAVEMALLSQQLSRVARSARCVDESFKLLADIRELEDRMSRPRPPLLRRAPTGSAER